MLVDLNPTERIIKTRPRALLRGHAAYQWQFIRGENGVRAERWFDLNKLNEQERIDWDSQEAEYASMPEDAQWVQPEPDAPSFPTLVLAEKWAALEDEEENIAPDMQAFHAPDECYRDAYDSLFRRREELMGWANTNWMINQCKEQV